MGPGFDCLGIALDIWNTVEVRSGGSGIEITGYGSDSLPRGESNLVYKSVRTALADAGFADVQVGIACHNEIPLGRGLGSSSAAVVGGLMAGNDLCGGPLSEQRILELAVKIEGHPDNAAAALLGGCQIVVEDAGYYHTSSVPVPDDLKAVLFVPDVPMPTQQARGILPSTIDRADAVFNIGRVALLVHAFATGDLRLLPVATDDKLHQPARQAIFHPMNAIFKAALGCGALGVFLSGAGSTVLALTRDREFTIGYEMADAADKSGLDGDVKITSPISLGAHVVGD